ncbi:MAG: hypothetical protein V5A45_06030 [Haloarculaceae archaeon]
MPMKGSGLATEWKEIDRFGDEESGGVGWIAYPDERMQRASHAIAVDGDVYVIDPVDAEGIDDLFAEFGEVAGVVILLDRHKRDAAAIATRHDVPVYVPHFMADISDDIAAPVDPFHRELADTGYAAHPILNNVAWSEAALYSKDTGVLVVPESVGTAEYFLTGRERLGVHPALRLVPPKKLGRLAPDRVLVGHGEGIHNEARAALRDAISGSRSRTPSLYFNIFKRSLPV